ncbi:MAG: hypothetical protein H7Z72_00240 [Bacteroidetes bacterium]|nr:hypothetical protein [Fibrella sp.]
MKKLLIVLLSGLLIAGCKGEPGSVGNPDVLTPTRTVGTGSGDLAVDGQALGIQPGDVVAIAPGSYKSLAFSNLTGTPEKRVTLVANGLVEVVGGGLSLTDVSYLTVTGGATAKNLLLRDNAYRGITISGRIPHALTLQGFRLRNIADYAVHYDNTATYDGTDATTLTDFKLLNSEFDNAGTVQISGNLDNSSGLVNTGFCKNPEVANCSFRDNPTVGTCLFFGNMEGGNIHHNVVDKVNTKNDNHNGVFFLNGNGSVHHNKCTNHQGNFVRFWIFSQGNTPKDVMMYDNIVWNSRKYSALEVQSFARFITPGVATYGNVRVINNTVGRLNTTLPTEFVGLVVDVYNLFGGDLQIVNNLSFNQVRTAANDGIWSQQSTTTPSLTANNRYFTTASAAGLVDLVAFRLRPNSPAKRAGAHQPDLAYDYYGVKRTNPPSVGAVE